MLASWVGAFLLFYGSEPGLLAVAGGFWAGWAACMVAYFLAKGLRELRDPGLRERTALAYASFLGRGTPMETFAGIPGERVAVDTLWRAADELRRGNVAPVGILLEGDNQPMQRALARATARQARAWLGTVDARGQSATRYSRSATCRPPRNRVYC